MFLSKRANGTYYLWFQDESGKRYKVSTGCKTKPEAMVFLRDFFKGEKDKKVKLQNITLSKFVVEFLNYSLSTHSPKTQRCFKISFREFIRIVGDKPLKIIGIRDIEKFLALKKSEATERTARTYFVTLASAFQSAVRWKYLQSNPFRLVDKPKLPEIQPAYFSRTDFQNLMKYTEKKEFQSLYMFAVSTGMRLGEILALQWTDVDFVRCVIEVRNSNSFTTKTKKNRTIPISEQLKTVLKERMKSASCELVFHRDTRKFSEEYVSKSFKKTVRRSGLSDNLHFHSLRHTFASWLVQDGVSLYEVQKLLGHSNIAVTQVYSHLQPEGLHSTVNRITIPLN